MTTKVPAELERQMDEAISHYPADQKRSASLPLLHLWQEHFGFISDEGVTWIAARLGLEPINILELVTFYPMFRQAPAGRETYPGLPYLELCDGGQLPLMENLRRLTKIDRGEEATGMHSPVAVSPEGELQHRVCRMPRELRHRTGLHGRRRPAREHRSGKRARTADSITHLRHSVNRLLPTRSNAG